MAKRDTPEPETITISSDVEKDSVNSSPLKPLKKIPRNVESNDEKLSNNRRASYSSSSITLGAQRSSHPNNDQQKTSKANELEAQHSSQPLEQIITPSNNFSSEHLSTSLDSDNYSLNINTPSIFNSHCNNFSSDQSTTSDSDNNSLKNTLGPERNNDATTFNQDKNLMHQTSTTAKRFNYGHNRNLNFIFYNCLSTEFTIQNRLAYVLTGRTFQKHIITKLKTQSPPIDDIFIEWQEKKQHVHYDLKQQRFFIPNASRWFNDKCIVTLPEEILAFYDKQNIEKLPENYYKKYEDIEFPVAKLLDRRVANGIVQYSTVFKDRYNYKYTRLVFSYLFVY